MAILWLISKNDAEFCCGKFIFISDRGQLPSIRWTAPLGSVLRSLSKA